MNWLAFVESACGSKGLPSKEGMGTKLNWGLLLLAAAQTILIIR